MWHLCEELHLSPEHAVLAGVNAVILTNASTGITHDF